MKSIEQNRKNAKRKEELLILLEHCGYSVKKQASQVQTSCLQGRFSQVDLTNSLDKLEEEVKQVKEYLKEYQGL